MDFDVVVIGAGTAGCLAARDIARANYSVALFDSSRRENLGKTVIVEVENGVWKFAGVTPPPAGEIPYESRRSRVLTPRGDFAFFIQKPTRITSVFYGKFVKRLLVNAEFAGARFHAGCAALSPIVEGGRVKGVRVRKGRQTFDVRARLVIDATGFDAALVRKLCPDCGIAWEDDKNDVVIAENEYSDIDGEKALRAIKEGLIADEETWMSVSRHGAYSTEFCQLSMKRRRAYILVGRKAVYGGPSLSELIGRHKAKQGYYGKTIYSGSGAIRIAHSLDRLVTDGFMAIGEAGCQVLPMHASGVSSALIAGSIAAKAAVKALTDNDTSTQALWPYAARYQRTRGALMAVFDVVRRVTEKFTEAQIVSALEDHIICPEDIANGAIPRFAFASPQTVPQRLLGLVKNPDLLPHVMKMGLATLAVKNHYSRYPERYDPESFERWRKKTRALFSSL